MLNHLTLICGLTQHYISNWLRRYSTVQSATIIIFVTGSRSKRQKFDDNIQNANYSQYTLRSHLEAHYSNTRFAKEKDALPPHQPKHFTPLILSYQNKSSKGTTTKDLSDVFSILDQSDGQHTGCIILVKGSAGIGKTELLKEIACCWARGSLLTKSSLVFLLRLKDRKVQKIDSLKKLVRYFYRYSNSKKIDDYEEKLEEKQGKSVVLLLDGFDEFPNKLQKRGFIADILHRYTLPYCSIVISSCPHAAEKLSTTFEVEIIGFDQQGQDDFVRKSLLGEPDALNKYRETNPAITSFCFIPFNMHVCSSNYV